MTPVGGEKDLERLKGVGSRYAVMLNDLGIRSIRDLCCRNPAWIKTMMESRHGLRLTLGECERWVLEAKQFNFPMH
jgi:predicted flap endonuclease-1-like 5' DNA nuclease